MSDEDVTMDPESYTAEDVEPDLEDEATEDSEERRLGLGDAGERTRVRDVPKPEDSPGLRPEDMEFVTTLKGD